MKNLLIVILGLDDPEVRYYLKRSVLGIMIGALTAGATAGAYTALKLLKKTEKHGKQEIK